MNQKELKQVVDFYNKVIMQQIIKPLEMRAVFKLVNPNGSDQIPYYQKMRQVTVYVQALQQEVLDGLEDLFEESDEEHLAITTDPQLSTYIPPDSAASPLEPDDTQSHNEGVDEDPTQVVDNESFDDDSPEFLAAVDDVITGIKEAAVQDAVTDAETLKEIKDEVKINDYTGLPDKALSLEDQIKLLQAEYENANANLKRSITMKLKGLKKRIDESTDYTG